MVVVTYTLTSNGSVAFSTTPGIFSRRDALCDAVPGVLLSPRTVSRTDAMPTFARLQSIRARLILIPLLILPAMLAVAKHIDADLATYEDEGNPVQQMILETIALFRRAIASPGLPCASDGCGSGAPSVCSTSKT